MSILHQIVFHQPLPNEQISFILIIPMSKGKVNTHPGPPMKAEGLRILARLIAIKHLNALNKKYHQKSGKARNENLP